MATIRCLVSRRTGVALLKRPQSSFRLNSLQPQQIRPFIGIGEVLGVITNPAETLRQLNESKELLRKAKEDLELSKEAKKIPKKHTFSKLPGFHGRKTEQALLRKVLSDAPKLSVIFGATSVGKTALLREVLATDDYFVIKFDLRISGFADLRTLYLALCENFERFFNDMHDEEMDNQGLTFKHLVLDLLNKEKAENGGHEVTVADIASLMESLQSCLLKYWEYDPAAKEAEALEESDKEPKQRKIETSNEKSKESTKAKSTDTEDGEEDDAEQKPTFRKRPVVFLIDEAHKLPALINDPLSLKVFLDTILVLTKQDRLCHVILSTSDSFFHHFLRSMNVGHHAQIMTIGDCTKEETLAYFMDEMLPNIPKHLASKANFEEIYDAFGGKLSHISDYLAAWVNAEGQLTPYKSAIFTQAYTLLQFHLTHTNFETFSPLSTATSGTSTDDDSARFSREDLLYVMEKLVQPPYSVPYFWLCRDVGTERIDSMIKTRILELRWTESISPEQNGVERVWSNDGIERAIVLPVTKIVHRAMEVVLKEEKEHPQRERKKKKPEKKRGKDKDDDDDDD